MSETPLVSVVVPVYNVERYLERCDSSIREQSYTNLEIVYVDDGSTDGSGRMCDMLAEKPGTHAVHKGNAGLGFARNTGMESATGRYVVFLDPDDYFDADLISDLVAPVANGAAEFTLAGFTRVEGGRSTSRFLPDVGTPITGSELVMSRVFGRMLGYFPGRDDYIEMSACARLYDLALIKREGIWFNSERECLSEDLDFNSRYLQHVGSALCTDSVGYFYCDNEGSLTNRYRPDRFQKQKELHARFWRVADELGLGEDAHVRLDNTLASIARYCIKLEYLRARGGGCSRREMLAAMDGICSDERLREALERLSAYPVPGKNRMVNALIAARRVRALAAVMAGKTRLGI